MPQKTFTPEKKKKLVLEFKAKLIETIKEFYNNPDNSKNIKTFDTQNLVYDYVSKKLNFERNECFSMDFNLKRVNSENPILNWQKPGCSGYEAFEHLHELKLI